MCNLPIRDQGKVIIGITVGFSLVTIVAVSLRIAGRLMRRERKLMFDDYAIILTTVSQCHRLLILFLSHC